MDELHRLYEHQTMMAIGIYSFLDNLLAHIPSRPDIDTETVPNSAEHGTTSEDPESNRLRLNVEEISLIGTGFRTGLSRERAERVRWVPRLSTWDLQGGVPLRQDADIESSIEATVAPRLVEETSEVTDQTEHPAKVEVTPGGYPEEIFIYLSEREKLEYMCSICYSVLKEAHQCQNDHRFCYGCIYTWSTGPNVGHDGCPVCRCDGLYAKNFDLVERINRKRVRCLSVGCNWMGMLSEYGSHEHRRYSPYELDLLIFSYTKDPLLKFTSNKSKEQEQITSEESLGESISLKPEQATVTEVMNNQAELVAPVGSMPATCVPVTTSLQQTESNGRTQLVTPTGLHRLGRYTGTGRSYTPVRTGTRRTHTRHSTTSGHTNEAVSQPNVNRPGSILSEARIHSRHSSTTPVNMPNIPRPLVTSRTTRSNSTALPQNTEHVPRNTNTRVRRQVRRRSRNSSRQSTSPNESNAQPNVTNSRELPSTSLSVWNETTLESSNGRTEPITTSDLIRNSVLPPPPVLSTESPPSTTFLAARNQLFPIESRIDIDTNSTSIPHQNTENALQTEIPDRRTEPCSLPAINPTATLTTGQNVRPSYEQQPPTNDDRFNVERHTSQSQQEQPDAPSHRPLEFRRLVPRRHGRVVEQLRETREQLASMLRLMTMELEERRQHVIATTIETAARSRALRNLNNQLSTRLDSENNELETERRPRATTPDRSHANLTTQERENHNLTNSWNVLRNLPTPDRSTTQRQPLRLLRLPRGTENNPNSSSEPMADSWTRRPPTGESPLANSAEEGDQPNGSSSSVATHNRLLTRLRVGAINQPLTPPILLVSRRRNLSALLSEIRYANSTVYSGWSSDDDEDT